MRKKDRYDQEVERFLKLLEGLMRFENLTIRDLERQLGWGKGTLNRIFSGRIELKVRHLVMLSEAVGVSPEDFFMLAYRKMPEGATMAQRVLIGRAEIEAAAPPPAPGKAAPAGMDELKGLMRSLLEELAQEREAEERRPRKPGRPR